MTVDENCYRKRLTQNTDVTKGSRYKLSGWTRRNETILYLWEMWVDWEHFVLFRMAHHMGRDLLLADSHRKLLTAANYKQFQKFLWELRHQSMTRVHSLNMGIEVVSPYTWYCVGVGQLHAEVTYNENVRARCCFWSLESRSVLPKNSGQVKAIWNELRCRARVTAQLPCIVDLPQVP
jgi:hypothetical protein